MYSVYCTSRTHDTVCWTIRFKGRSTALLGSPVSYQRHGTKNPVLNLHSLCEFRGAEAHATHPVTCPAAVNLGTLWVNSSEKQVTAQALLCWELHTPGQAGEAEGKAEYLAPTDFYQHHRGEALLWAEKYVLGPGALMGLKGPDQLHLGCGAPFNKLSPTGEFLVVSCPWGNSWLL